MAHISRKRCGAGLRAWKRGALEHGALEHRARGGSGPACTHWGRLRVGMCPLWSTANVPAFCGSFSSSVSSALGRKEGFNRRICGERCHQLTVGAELTLLGQNRDRTMPRKRAKAAVCKLPRKKQQDFSENIGTNTLERKHYLLTNSRKMGEVKYHSLSYTPCVMELPWWTPNLPQKSGSFPYTKMLK